MRCTCGIIFENACDHAEHKLLKNRLAVKMGYLSGEHRAACSNCGITQGDALLSLEFDGKVKFDEKHIPVEVFCKTCKEQL